MKTKAIYITAIILFAFSYNFSAKASETRSQHSSEKVIAFPGAEGGGKYASGGRGGKIIKVTNLNDNGPGSLREAVDTPGPRIIIFEVSGNIILKSELKIIRGNVTIAGQTAPGDGICIQNFPTTIRANNVIIRFLRFRLGDITKKEYDVLGGYHTNNVIIDHCSISWGIDETASFYGNKNFTMQWCIISESLNDSYHPKGPHGMGAIWGGNNASFHHNLLAHHNARSPRFNGGRRSGMGNIFLEDKIDFRNNVIYNWGGISTYGGENGNYNMVANYYKSGPASDKRKKVINRINIDANIEKFPPGFGKYFIEENILEGSNTTNNWELVTFSNGVDLNIAKISSPIDVEPIHTQTAKEAYKAVLKHVGASLFRDAVDSRIIEETKTSTSTFKGSKTGKLGIIDSQNDVGGWPLLNSIPAPKNASGDGIPDTWKIKHKLIPTLFQANGKDLSKDYDNIEVYVNSLVNHLYE